MSPSLMCLFVGCLQNVVMFLTLEQIKAQFVKFNEGH